MLEGKFTGENVCEREEISGPSREPAIFIVQRALEVKRQELAALEHLEKLLAKGGIETGSPLETLLWGLITRNRSRL